MTDPAGVLPGTLDLLVLKAASLGGETASWNHRAEAVARVLAAMPQEAR